MSAQRRRLEGEDLFLQQTSLLLLTVNGTESQALAKRRDIFLQGYHCGHMIQVLSIDTVIVPYLLFILDQSFPSSIDVQKADSAICKTVK